MASLTQWAWVWVNSKRQWRTESLECCSPWDRSQLSDRTTLSWLGLCYKNFEMIWGEHSQLRLQEHLYAQQLHSYVLSYCMSSFVLFLSTIFSPFSFCLQKPHPSQRAYLYSSSPCRVLFLSAKYLLTFSSPKILPSISQGVMLFSFFFIILFYF